MPIHDWSRVDAGLFHDFHQTWVPEIKRELNRGLLPEGYYALVEQHGGAFELGLLTLMSQTPEPSVPVSDSGVTDAPDGNVVVAEPKVRVRAETDLDFYRRKQTVVAVRHTSGDDLVALVEVVSRGNKSGRAAFEAFIKKATEYLAHGIHLLIIDLQPPTRRDPHGIHGAIWDALDGSDYAAPADKPLTLAAYEAGCAVRAFVEPIAVRDPLTAMPLFLRPGRHVLVPLEETYARAWETVPRRWRDVITAP
jgi:hypothetical protein